MTRGVNIELVTPLQSSIRVPKKRIVSLGIDSMQRTVFWAASSLCGLAAANLVQFSLPYLFCAFHSLLGVVNVATKSSHAILLHTVEAQQDSVDLGREFVVTP